MIEAEQIRRAITCIAAVPGAEFDSDALADDAFALACVFTSPEEYDVAVRSTIRAISLIAADRISASQLDGDYNGWTSYHFQHRAAQGAKADMRIMFRRTGTVVRVRGFGHRRMPADFYHRMSETGRLL